MAKKVVRPINTSGHIRMYDLIDGHREVVFLLTQHHRSYNDRYGEIARGLTGHIRTDGSNGVCL